MLTLELSNAQKAIYKELSNQITAKTGSSVESIRELVRFGHRMIANKRAENKARINENNDTLSKRLADEANEQIQQEEKAFINDIKTVLLKQKTASFSVKRDAVAQFVKQMPSDSLGKKLQYVCEYGHLFNKEVWEIFINDPNITGNFIAQTIVQKKAEQNGIDYVTGFNYERVMDKLNDIETMATESINHIDEYDSLTLLSFISENPNSPASKLIADLDTDIATVIPAERRTVLKRLKDAEKHAYNVDDVRTSARIKAFVEMYTNELSTPEELKEELYSRAEELISQGMSAKK